MDLIGHIKLTENSKTPPGMDISYISVQASFKIQKYLLINNIIWWIYVKFQSGIYTSITIIILKQK